jgi:hypothetical protein
MIVGGYALAFHGAPRYTGDMALYVRPTPENARRILAALDAFGFGSLDLNARDFSRPDRVVQLGVPPVRVDLITSLSGVTWEECWAGREPGLYGDVPVSFIGRVQSSSLTSVRSAELKTSQIWKPSERAERAFAWAARRSAGGRR